MVNKLWSDEQPKESGFYWCKGADGKGVVAQIKRGGVALFAGVVAPGPLKWSVKAIRFPSLYEANKVEKTLKELTIAVTDFLVGLDAAMKEPESAARGAKIATLSNKLNFANDSVMHFALDMPFDSMNALVKKRERLRQRTSASSGDNNAAVESFLQP